MKRTFNKLLIAGTGTRGGSDDAIGLRLVELLAPEFQRQNIETRYWEGADALTLTQELLELDSQVLIVDCADMGIPSGQSRHFSLGDIRSKAPRAGISTHGFGILEALELAKALGFEQPVSFFGIQPFDLSAGMEMTAEMKALEFGLCTELRQCVAELKGLTDTLCAKTA